MHDGLTPRASVLRLGPNATPTRLAAPLSAGEREYASWELSATFVVGAQEFERTPSGWVYVAGYTYSDEGCWQTEPPRSTAHPSQADKPGTDAGRATPAVSDAPPVVAAAGGVPFYAASDECLMSTVEGLCQSRDLEWLRNAKAITYANSEVTVLNDRPSGVSGGVR